MPSKAISLILNEHSLPDNLDHNFDNWATGLLQTYKKAKEAQSRIQNIRISHEAKQAIIQSSHIANVRKEIVSILLKTLRPPYFEDENLDEKQEEEFVLFQANAPIYNIHDSECLKISKIFGFPLLSSNEDPWKVCSIEGYLLVREENIDYSWPNLFNPISIKDCNEEILVELSPAQPPVSGLTTREVSIYIQHHHGKDVLEKFALTIATSPYVLRIESDEWRPKRKRFFIKSSYVDNYWYVHLTLYKIDAGFGFLVRTTARNKYEADFIGNELEKLY